MDYAALAQKYGGTTATSASPAVPKVDEIAAKYGGKAVTAPAAPTEIPKQGGNVLADFAKSIFSAPVTLLARPVQAAVGLGQEFLGNGYDPDAIEAATKKVPLFGDLVAPIPKTGGDVLKDVGRGAQTVALGLGPVAGGALFGAGQAVQDQDAKDLLSAQTAFDIALGAGGGKLAGLLGKPLISTAGKVVGTITPKILKDVAAKGADSITQFAATHDLLGGIASKPAAAIARGGEAVDNAVNTAFKKGGSTLMKTAAEQFPDMSPTKHYLGINSRDIVQPTKVNQAAYNKATDIFTDAKNKGIDLGEVANNRGIQHTDLVEGNRYATADAAEGLRQNNFKVSNDLIRPAIQAADPGVARVPIENVRNAMVAKIKAIPSSQIADEERATILKQIEKRYADDGAAAKAHPDGFSLTDLHDSRIAAASNGKYKPGQPASDALKAQRSREEGRVFSQLFDDSAPDSLGIKPAKKELEKNFLLADYLDSLDTKKVPEGVTKKAVRLFGRATAATVGGKIGGFPGAILGSQYGDMLFSGFEALPNPIKQSVLTNFFNQRGTNPSFDALRQYLGEQETAKILRKALPPPGSSSYKPNSPTMYVTPKGKATTVRSEANDVGNVESGKIKPPSLNELF